MDIYVQLSVCEGWGLPIPEAKACGVTVFGTDCTAISEQVNCDGGFPVMVKAKFTDNGTMQRRSIPDIQNLTLGLYNFFKLEIPFDKDIQKSLRDSVVGSWDKAAAIWMKYFDSAEIKDRSKTWDMPIAMVDVDNFRLLPNGTFEQQLERMYRELLGIEPIPHAIAALKKQNAPLDLILKDFKKRASKKNSLERLRGWGCDSQAEASSLIDPSDKFRILYVMPKSAGDVLISTGVVRALKEQYPSSSIYFATEEPYASILDGNPFIKKVMPYEKELIDYQITEGCAQDKGDFDMTFCPYILTQTIPQVWHNGHGMTMGETYAAVCGVKLGKPWIGKDRSLNPPGKYITIHTGSSLEIKNYDYFNEVMKYCKWPIVQVGSIDDELIDREDVLDLRGKTTPQQLASIIEKAALHVGVDSFPAHVAGAVGTDVITIFGSTFASKCKPATNGVATSIAIEPTNRWDCHKACHLIQCTQRSKCINNILPYDDIVEPLSLLYPAIFTRFKL